MTRFLIKKKIFHSISKRKTFMHNKNLLLHYDYIIISYLLLIVLKLHILGS